MEDLRGTLEAITSMDIEGLRTEWRRRLGEPPLVRSPDLLRRALAEELQMQAEGRDLALEKRLAKTAARHRTGLRPKVRTTAFKTGSLIIREWQGQRHEVEVVPGGFRWRGETYASLSKIARLITGVRWNGPRFFHLRDAGDSE